MSYEDKIKRPEPAERGPMPPSGLPWEGYYYSSYGIAVKHGFKGTEEEWLAQEKTYAEAAGAAATLAESARDAAEGYATTASSAAASASGDKDNAAASAAAAASARDAAISAKEDAVDAKTDAVSAKTTAVAAKEAAEDAQTAAEAAANEAESYSSHPPIIGDSGNWELWDGDSYEDSGKPSQGADGQDGAPGQDGADGAPGQDGVSPGVSISEITGGHSVTITDADHPGGQSFNVMDGEDGADGDDGVSPGVSVSTITGGHKVTITDADHPSGQSFDVMDGADGTSFVIKGLYATLADLVLAHPTGSAGDAYAVGTSSSNTTYIWDVDENDWTNIGSIQGPAGADGQDGVSPEVTVASITGGHSVTITDADHPSGQTFNVMDGEDGQDGAAGTDGVSPGVSISNITGGHTVTITDKDHPSGQSFNVMDGADGQDGQDGQDGAPGPNQVTNSTTTNITGLLKGNGAAVSAATAGNDYVAPSDLTDIRATGLTNATGAPITAGTYFYLNNVLVQAKVDIANGATFTLNTNYEVPTAGALNALKSALAQKDWTSIGALYSDTPVTINLANYSEVLFVYRVSGNIYGSNVYPARVLEASSTFFTAIYQNNSYNASLRFDVNSTRTVISVAYNTITGWNSIAVYVYAR